MISHSDGDAQIPDWAIAYPDLASRYVYGAVIWANDEFFAEREALIRPEEPQFTPKNFGAKGQIYDGWETRRRRGVACDALPPENDYDSAIIRLGVPGIIQGFLVDTSWFKGNYPPHIAIDGAFISDYPSAVNIAEEGKWQEIIPQSPCRGDYTNYYAIEDNAHIFTHIRLRIYPDGGVARLRAYGIPAIDPRYAALGAVDLVALESGAYISGCSNRFYSSPNNAISPGRSRVMGEGWETSRRRTMGNEWLKIRLAAPAHVAMIGIDTSYFIGNSPAKISVTGISGEKSYRLLDHIEVQPDTRHSFPVIDSPEVDALRLDIFPDGGIARIHAWGKFTPEGLSQIAQRWPQ